MSESTDVADALVTLLTGTYTIGAVTPERTWNPRKERRDLVQFKVFVVPDQRQLSSAGRGPNQKDFGPVVFVTQAVDPDENAAVDPLSDLLEELEEAAIKQHLTVGGDQYSWISQEPAEIADAYLIEKRVFAGAFQPNYRLTES